MQIDDQKILKPNNLTLITGCMFSGKTTLLIQIINEIAKYSREKYEVFTANPTLVSKEDICLQTHGGVTFPAKTVVNIEDIQQYLHKDIEYLIIDEVQFLSHAVIEYLVDQIQKQDISVIVGGLSLDFRKLPFGSVHLLSARADVIVKLQARCSICNGPAHFTQRISGDRIPNIHEPVLDVGGVDKYTARCYKHHQISGLSHDKNASEKKIEVIDHLISIRSIAKTAMNYGASQDPHKLLYELERYSYIYKLVNECLSQVVSIDSETVFELDEQLSFDDTYVTPKIATAYAVYDDLDRVLLVKRKDLNVWALPGGWADVDTNAIGNAVRELSQETGVNALQHRFVGVFDVRKYQLSESHRDATPIYLLVFCGRTTSIEPIPNYSEVSNARFFSLDSLPKLSAGVQIQIVHSYKVLNGEYALFD